MHFGENQLSRSLIGLSPLPTAHPPGFQPRWVRSSTRSYTRLNLAMGRSPRFGSAPRNSTALFGLALATATPHGLTSRHATDSQAHSSKGTPPPHPKGGAMTDYQHMVSGTLSLPSRGTFHHSLTVLIRYRSPGGIQAAKRSWQTHTGFHEPRATTGTHPHPRQPGSAYGAITRSGTPSQTLRLPDHASAPPQRRRETSTPHNPAAATPAGSRTTTV